MSAVVACNAPDPRKKCQGWNITAGPYNVAGHIFQVPTYAVHAPRDFSLLEMGPVLLVPLSTAPGTGTVAL